MQISILYLAIDDVTKNMCINIHIRHVIRVNFAMIKFSDFLYNNIKFNLCLYINESKSNY